MLERAAVLDLAEEVEVLDRAVEAAGPVQAEATPVLSAREAALASAAEVVVAQVAERLVLDLFYPFAARDRVV